MNGLDLVIILIIIGSFIRGYRLGLVRTLINFLGFFIALFLAYQLTPTISPIVQGYLPVPTFENSLLHMFSESYQLHYMFYNAITFILIFIIAKVLLSIASHVLHSVASLPLLATINRISGAFVGIIQAGLIVIILIHVISVMPWQELKQYIEASTISTYLMSLTPFFTELLYKLWNTSFELAMIQEYFFI